MCRKPVCEQSRIGAKTPPRSMALRAFHCNPCLGGFGGESSGAWSDRDQSDAFAQIVKELVDNAVDACSAAKHNGGDKKRVRVTLAEDVSSSNACLLTVSDNGCGMSNIQACVDAFSSTKTKQTAGRYGIGLTLCLLHAQRLVPGSKATITSGAKRSKQFVRASFLVDTDKDKIKCVQEEKLPKTVKGESGTTVSLVLPVSFSHWRPSVPKVLSSLAGR